MALAAPEWLTRHEGTLQLFPDKRSWAVLIDGGPQYRLTPVPVAGKFGCEVTQTINGRRLDKGSNYPTSEEAMQGGLEDLRLTLGW